MSRNHRTIVLAFALAFLLPFARPAAADPEVCGDGLDNDDDGLTDEGCYPEGITGVCENPLDCATTGSVSPATGALVYHVQPDLMPTVAYGPGIGFQRFYMSKYDTGYDCDSGSATNYKNPMGCRWHHNYMSWLTKDTTPNPDQVIVHLVTGQDVLFTFSHTGTGEDHFDYYTPQPGFHYAYLRQNTESPYHWELRTLTGNAYEYDWSSPTGKLVKIYDSVGKYITLAYSNGQVQWITDSAGTRKLKLSYQASEPYFLEWVELYTDTGGGDTERVQVKFLYAGAGDYFLEEVQMGSSLVKVAEYDYDANDYLRQVKDGETTQKLLASFYYLTGQPGTVARIETPDGDVGYAYDACPDAGQNYTGTYVSFHHDTSVVSTCDDDNDCDSFFCGGETNPASANTGACFQARRCILFDEDNEDLITAVSGSCASCTKSETYAWETPDGGVPLPELLGIESADDVWTSYARDSNGMVTLMVEGDNDSDASNQAPAGARESFYFYGNASFPGRLTERRVHSAVYDGTCDATTTTACRQSLYTYTSGGLLEEVQESGWTVVPSGDPPTYSYGSYTYSTEYVYDGNGRLTNIYGPRDDDLEFTYHTSAGMSQGYLDQVKRKKATDVYVTTAYSNYDYWGNAGTITDPNSDTTSLAYHADYNLLTSREVDTLSEEYVYTYDTHRRLTKIQRPKLNCQVYAYDAEGRISSITEKDYNSGTST